VNLGIDDHSASRGLSGGILCGGAAGAKRHQRRACAEQVEDIASCNHAQSLPRCANFAILAMTLVAIVPASAFRHNADSGPSRHVPIPGTDKTENSTMANITWDHIHLRTTNPDAMAAWFEKMLGAQVLRSQQDGKPRIDLKLGGANIFIAPVKEGDGTNTAPAIPYRGLDHFGLSVSGIDAIAADLKAKGVEFTKEPTTVRPGVRICFIRAPEGVSIELLDRTHK
jgi:catechol 2,3-dioxygenase-like lactoylglutathione lyase family enzyme